MKALLAADPLIGARIDDRYIVRGVLGRGGMGVVYDGVHEQLGREVAIKVLGAGMASDPTSVERFLREARIASQLTHGNIVDVSDLGQLPDGRPYLVMARLHGHDLCTLLQRHGCQTPARTVELLRGAAAALDLIHAKGFVHRDVKPENLMHVVRQDGSEAVLLLDFGIVGLVSPESTRLTAAGVLFGTPAYLAPEVIRGGRPEPRSDLYALATVAFELMTGEPPFSSNNPFELMQDKVTYDAPSLQEVAGREFPETVERVIAGALRRDPRERPPSATDFIDALEIAVHLHATQLHSSRTGGPAESPVLHGKAASSVPAPGGVDEAAAAPEHVTSIAAPSAAAQLSKQPTYVLPRRSWRWAALATVLGAMLVSVGLRLIRKPATVNPTHTAHVVQPAQPPDPRLSAADGSPVLSEPELPVTTPAVELDPEKPASQDKAMSARTMGRHAGRAPAPAPAPAVDSLPSESAADLIRKAQAELVQGHLAAASRLYLRATQIEPNNAAAYRGLGLLHERLGHSAEAASALKHAMRLAPGDPNNAQLSARVQRLEAGR